MAKLSDYMPRPTGVDPGKAKERGWGDGWPHCQRSHIVAVQRAGVTVHVRREIAQLVATLLEATEKRHHYDIKGEQTGGFNCRPIAGTQKPSNHSWGLAVDINWKANPRDSRFITNLPPAVVRMWGSCGFQWGGYYRTPDTMHFEYVGRPSDVASHLATARGQGNGMPAFVPPPITLTHPNTRGDRVRFVQERLNAKGASPRLVVDGTWGPRTDQELREFQKRAGLSVDGIYGPKTHAALVG
jgi:hypothetical protein